MKNPADLRRYAPLGLILSGLATLSLIITFIVQALTSAGLVTFPDPELLNRILWISGSLIIVGVAITSILNPEGVRQFVSGRQAQYGSNSAIALFAFIGILIFINMLAFDNAKTWDLSENGQTSLAPETLRILESLPAPISARAYYSSRYPVDTTRSLLEKLKENSAGKFEYEFINPELDVVAAQNDGVERDGTIVLQLGELKEFVTLPDEQNIDAAILRLTNPEKRVLYFLIGHGELDTETAADTSLNAIRGVLENKNYTVLLLDLKSTSSVPADAKAVILAGPQRPLFIEEVSALRNYLANGGGLVVLRETKALLKQSPTTEIADPLDELLAAWGITLNADLVLDPNANPSIVAIANPQSYPNHPITRDLAGYYSLFPTSGSITLNTPPENINSVALASTAESAWGESDIASIEGNGASFDPTTDLSGPVILAVAGEDLLSKARLVVFADSEFATDTWYKRGNGDILINAIDWAATQDNLINLTPKETIERTYNPPSMFGFISVLILSLCFIPLGVFAAGFWVWFKRRRQG